MAEIEVFSMPYNARGNPYFLLWRRALEAHRGEAVLREVPRQSVFLLLLQHPWTSPRRILCIHWPTVLYGSRYALRSILRLCVNIPTLFALKALFGFKIVWVLHNAREHDYPHPRIDRLGRFLVALAADGLVAQQASTAKTCEILYPRKKVAYIPHSNYGSFFGPLAQRDPALRERLGFASGDIVLAALGAVRPYKKIERIFEAMRAAGADLDPRIRLWIAGGGDEGYLQKLKALAADVPGTVFGDAFIPDDRMASYAACADYAVFYFDDSELTSGSIQLSLSLGLPVIARDIPGAEQVRHGRNGYVFRDVQDLGALLRALPGLPVPSQEAVAASIAPHTWESAAQKHIALWKALM
ncbi:MAG TPA: glycosyltransferase [Candidatus Paceibacterota bacterium]|nr:glycosyltransferase [Candidatus Paceibacterota bacterium]